MAKHGECVDLGGRRFVKKKYALRRAQKEQEEKTKAVEKCQSSFPEPLSGPTAHQIRKSTDAVG